MTLEQKCWMALERLADNPRNDEAIKHIAAYIVELQDNITILQQAIHSRSREDNFHRASDLIEARIDELILSTYTTI